MVMTVRELHDKAMEEAYRAQFAEHRDSDAIRAKMLYCDACMYEWAAARQLPIDEDSEPTRSILFRSAGWLALNSGHPRVAKDLAKQGLDGFPPREIWGELLELIAAANKAIEG